MHDAIRFDLNLYLDDHTDRQTSLVQDCFDCAHSHAVEIVINGRIRRHAREPLWIVATPAQFLAWVNARANLKGDWDGLQAHMVDTLPGVDYDMTGDD